jgi:hypothetical protein
MENLKAKGGSDKRRLGTPGLGVIKTKTFRKSVLLPSSGERRTEA